MLEMLERFNKVDKLSKKDCELKKAVTQLIKEDRKLKNAILLDCAVGMMVVGAIVCLKVHKCHKYHKNTRCNNEEY